MRRGEATGERWQLLATTRVQEAVLSVATHQMSTVTILIDNTWYELFEVEFFGLQSEEHCSETSMRKHALGGKRDGFRSRAWNYAQYR
jgi:hypothetical protein